MAKVRAVAQGFDGVCLRNPGEEFDFDGAPGPWFEYLDPKEQKAAVEKVNAEAGARLRAEIEAKARTEIEAKVKLEFTESERSKIEAEVKADLETKVRADVKAKLAAAGKIDASELV